jgi:hypothetical protein
MEEAIRIDRRNRRIGLSPELADLCLTCGTCASGCGATGLVPGWDPRKAIRAIALGLAGGYRLQMALGLHHLRPVPIRMSHGHRAYEDISGMPHLAGAK